MKTLIVGIDPGTTLGYAVLDTEGNILKIGSEKNITLSDFILKIFKHGTPILAGTDKRNVPNYISNFAAKTGCKIVHPRSDLLKKEKKELIGNTKTRNDHEDDALAAAIITWEEYRSLFQRIRSFLKERERSELEDELKAFLVKNEELNINEAYNQLTKEPEAAVVKIPKKRELRKKSKIEIELENKVVLLENENKRLKDKLRLLGQLKKKLKSLSKSSEKEIVNHKEQRIKKVLFDHKKLKRNYEHQLKELKRKDLFISELTDKVILKKLLNLGQEEFEKKRKILNITEEDVLLVDNPNIINEKVYDYLKNKVKVIIFKKKPVVKKDFTYLDARSFKLQETDNFASAPKQDFEQSISKKDLLKNILREYKTRRST